jgi:hypothetical protein
LGIDPTLIAEGLRETPTERLLGFQALYRTAQQLGGKAFARGGP